MRCINIDTLLLAATRSGGCRPRRTTNGSGGSGSRSDSYKEVGVWCIFAQFVCSALSAGFFSFFFSVPAASIYLCVYLFFFFVCAANNMRSWRLRVSAITRPRPAPPAHCLPLCCFVCLPLCLSAYLFVSMYFCCRCCCCVSASFLSSFTLPQVACALSGGRAAPSRHLYEWL